MRLAAQPASSRQVDLAAGRRKCVPLSAEALQALSVGIASILVLHKEIEEVALVGDLLASIWPGDGPQVMAERGAGGLGPSDDRGPHLRAAPRARRHPGFVSLKKVDRQLLGSEGKHRAEFRGAFVVITAVAAGAGLLVEGEPDWPPADDVELLTVDGAPDAADPAVDVVLLLLPQPPRASAAAQDAAAASLVLGMTPPMARAGPGHRDARNHKSFPPKSAFAFAPRPKSKVQWLCRPPGGTRSS